MHPHGYYPTGAGFLHLLPSFKARLPGVAPATLVASALFAAPFLRDVGAWSGFRRVTRSTFIRALRDKGAVLLCPGGQAEMCHTHRMFDSGGGGGGAGAGAATGEALELVVHARHKGFCKIAIEQQAALVPVLALGEALQLRNLAHAPALQAFTTRRLRFPFPFWLGGRWVVTPLPRRVPLVYVIGEPIPPPPLRAGASAGACEPPGAAGGARHERGGGGGGGGGGAAQCDVDALHAAYYGSLADLYRRYRHTHPSFARARLVLAYD